MYFVTYITRHVSTSVHHPCLTHSFVHSFVGLFVHSCTYNILLLLLFHHAELYLWYN